MNETSVLSPNLCRARNSSSGVGAAPTTHHVSGHVALTTASPTPDTANTTSDSSNSKNVSRRSGRRGSSGSNGGKDVAASSSSPSSPKYVLRMLFESEYSDNRIF